MASAQAAAGGGGDGDELRLASARCAHAPARAAPGPRHRGADAWDRVMVHGGPHMHVEATARAVASPLVKTRCTAATPNCRIRQASGRRAAPPRAVDIAIEGVPVWGRGGAAYDADNLAQRVAGRGATSTAYGRGSSPSVLLRLRHGHLRSTRSKRHDERARRSTLSAAPYIPIPRPHGVIKYAAPGMEDPRCRGGRPDVVPQYAASTRSWFHGGGPE